METREATISERLNSIKVEPKVKEWRAKLRKIDEAESEAAKARPGNYADKDIEVEHFDDGSVKITRGSSSIEFRIEEIPRLEDLILYLDKLLFGEIPSLKAKLEALLKENQQLWTKLRACEHQ